MAQAVKLATKTDMRKLKKWHRFGIVISFIWVIYSVSSSRNTEMEGNKIFRDMDYQTCRDDKKEFEVCWDEAWKKNPDTPYWTAHFANALIPLAGVWLLVFISIGTYRWIMRGQ